MARGSFVQTTPTRSTRTMGVRAASISSRMTRGFRLFAATALVSWTLGCGGGGDAAPINNADPDGASDATVEAGAEAQSDTGSAGVSCLGSVYPSRGPIDPDGPDYEESGWTKQDVADAFAEAKTQGTKAFRAYKAAHTYPELLECAFCACGCASTFGHVSALDCFKDMHGFNCGYCQDIALRMETLVQEGLGDDEVRETLLVEFPEI